MTESTSPNTDGQSGASGTPTRRRGLLPGTWTEFAGAAVGLLAIVVTVFGVKFFSDDDPDTGTALPAPTKPAATGTTAPTATPSPAAVEGRKVSELPRIGGVLTELPDEVDPAKFPDAVAAECPSNQTGETVRSLSYELDRRYRTFTVSISAWADTKEPDPILVRVYIRTKQIDDTFVTTEQAALNRVVNGPAATLTAKVKDANELVLAIECHRPDGVVILSDPRVHP